MSRTNPDLPIKQIFQDLDEVDPRDPVLAAQKRALYLQQVASLRHSLPEQNKQKAGNAKISAGSSRHLPIHPSFLRSLMTASLIVIIVLAASMTTVYASQDSLPGQSLYPIKTLSEDTLLALTFEPQSRVDRELDYTDRRISEIEALISAGVIIPNQVSDRLQSELDSILQDASEMSDSMLVEVLPLLRLRAEQQLERTDGMVSGVPGADLPVLLQVQARIREQVRLCAMGQSDPRGFRIQVRQRFQYRNGSGSNSSLENENAITVDSSGAGNGYGPGEGSGQQGSSETQVPGGNGNGNGYGQPTSSGNLAFPTSGSYGPEASATQDPGGQKKGH